MGKIKRIFNRLFKKDKPEKVERYGLIKQLLKENGEIPVFCVQGTDGVIPEYAVVVGESYTIVALEQTIIGSFVELRERSHRMTYNPNWFIPTSGGGNENIEPVPAEPEAITLGD